MSRFLRTGTTILQACTCSCTSSLRLIPKTRSISTKSLSGPTAAYNKRVLAGTVQNDDHQRGIVALLQTMYEQLDSYEPSPVPAPYETIKPSFFSSIFKSSTHATPEISNSIPKGLYLYGSVGCGKSFLMDLFYDNLPKRFENSKRRIHFHAFMMDVHKRGHKMKMEKGDRADWIVPIARELAMEARVLCFDEFQVSF